MCSRALIPGLLPYEQSKKFTYISQVNEEDVPDNKKATKFGLAIFTGKPFSVYKPEYIDETGEKGFVLQMQLSCVASFSRHVHKYV